MRAVLLLLLLISFSVAPAAGQRTSSSTKQKTEAPKYTGLRYGPTQPKGLKYISGALISDIKDEKEYGISEIHKGSVKVLWFERLSRRDEKGIPYWELKDALAVPPFPRSQILVYAMCLLDERPDTEIVAIADHRPNDQYFTRVRKAWRANRQTEKFEVIPTKGVKCENPASGL